MSLYYRTETLPRYNYLKENSCEYENSLRNVPELVLRCFPVLLKIIPNKIIFPFLKLVRENRFLHAMKRELQLLSVPGLLRMIEQPLCTIPGLADVADLLRTGIAEEIQARACRSGYSFFRCKHFIAAP